MKHEDRKKLLEALDPEQLVGGKTQAAKAEGYFRWHLIILLADIADQQDSLAACYRRMLAIQEARTAPKA